MKRLKYILVAMGLATSFFIYSATPKKREMRAVWIATVANIDWPSSNNLTVESQQKEMIDMLDKLRANNINAIIFQIRPTADSFYPSNLEPWSFYLTGEQGKRPNPFYDPLKFVIKEAHKRCMEVHGWINPYRVTNDPKHIEGLSKNHTFYKNRELFVEYGGKYYFNPGLDETRDFLNNVVEDLVMRYDLDALHFDDYFYPYPVGKEEFPDQDTFEKYPRGYAMHQKADWRRHNVDLIIKELNTTIKSLKPWVQFGVSPFGVWRNSYVDPRGSNTRAGITNYDDLYADILKWLQEGSIDYIVPQLYWEIGKRVADYKILIKWWSEHTYNKNLYIGLYASGLFINRTPSWKYGNQLVSQLRLNEKYPNVDGVAYFSAKPFLKNPKRLLNELKVNYYRCPAIQPICKNIKGSTPPAPQNVKILKDDDQTFIFWDKIEETGGNEISYYVLYGFKGNRVGDLSNPENIVAVTNDNFINLAKLEKRLQGKMTFVVTAINRYKQESTPTFGVSRKL